MTEVLFQVETIDHPTQLEVMDQNKDLLRKMPGVSVRPLRQAMCRVTLPAGTHKKKIFDRAGMHTYLYRLPGGQVLGSDITDANLPRSLWIATEAMWNAKDTEAIALANMELFEYKGVIPAGQRGQGTAQRLKEIKDRFDIMFEGMR